MPATTPFDTRKPARSWRSHAASWTTAAALVAAGWAVWPSTSTPAPIASWQVAGKAAFEPFEAVPPHTGIGLELDLPETSFVYAVRHDRVGGWVALMPSTSLNSELPDSQPQFPAGSLTLPGRQSDRELRWSTGESVGRIAFLVIVSARRLTDVETALARCEQMGNAAFPQRTLLDPYAPRTGMDRVPARNATLHPLFDEAAAAMGAANGSPLRPAAKRPDVFVGCLCVQHALSEQTIGTRTGREAVQKLQEQLQDRINELKSGATPAPPK
jgi:hypothetical protein